jgi:hypothetical protein
MHEAFQMVFVEYDHMIEQFTSTAADESFRNAIRPRASEAGPFHLDTKWLPYIIENAMEFNPDGVLARANDLSGLKRSNFWNSSRVVGPRSLSSRTPSWLMMKVFTPVTPYSARQAMPLFLVPGLENGELMAQGDNFCLQGYSRTQCITQECKQRHQDQDHR